MNKSHAADSQPEAVVPSRRAFDDANAVIPSCALTEEGLQSQRARMRQLGPSVAEFQRHTDCVTIAFKPGYDRQLLDQTVAVERDCCPFFRLRLDESADELTVSVEDPKHGAGLDALAYALGVGHPR